MALAGKVLETTPSQSRLEVARPGRGRRISGSTGAVVGLYQWYNQWYSAPMQLQELVTFEDPALARAWRGRRVPMSDLYEAYVDGRVDIQPDKWRSFFETRHQTLSFRLTDSHVKWAFTNFLPGGAAAHEGARTAASSATTTTAATTSSRGFWARPMVYTAAYYETPSDSRSRKRSTSQDRALLPEASARARAIGCSTSAAAGAPSWRSAAREFGVRALRRHAGAGAGRFRQRAHRQETASPSAPSSRCATTAT